MSKTKQVKNINNSLRIVAGQWRGRKLSFPPIDGLRPTPDRVRETLFNWLQNHIREAKVLDLFSGSGALGLEALSRGAKSATFVEQNKQAAKSIQQHLQSLGCDNAQVINADVLTTLKAIPTQSHEVVLLDPPFRQNLLAPCIELLEQQGWLTNPAWIYIEAEKELDSLLLPPAWTLFRSKQAGQIAYHLFNRRKQ